MIKVFGFSEEFTPKQQFYSTLPISFNKAKVRRSVRHFCQRFIFRDNTVYQGCSLANEKLSIFWIFKRAFLLIYPTSSFSSET